MLPQYTLATSFSGRGEAAWYVILALVNTRKWRIRSRLPEDEIIELLTKLKM